MQNEKKRLSKNQYLTRLVLLIALTLTIEMLGLPQPVTGPLVNAMLFLTTMILGAPAGVTLGTITPLVAALRGQLPPPLVPFVPFIICGNILLVLVYFAFKRTIKKRSKLGHWSGVTAAALVKFIWLATSANMLLPLLAGRNLPSRIVTMMTLPQFLTAFAGGILAYFFYTFLVRAGLVRA